MVCHELCQPLTAIHSSLGYLIGIGSQDFPNEWRKILEIAYRNTLRMLRSVNDLQETSALSREYTYCSRRFEFEQRSSRSDRTQPTGGDSG